VNLLKGGKISDQNAGFRGPPGRKGTNIVGNGGGRGSPQEEDRTCPITREKELRRKRGGDSRGRIK